jgi:hypothetical protein
MQRSVVLRCRCFQWPLRKQRPAFLTRRVVMKSMISKSCKMASCFVASVTIFFPGTALGARYFVKMNGSPSGPGNDWAHAYDNPDRVLQMPLDPNDEIWVAAGTYKPLTPTIPSDPRSKTFFFGPNQTGVRMYGGFAGTESEFPPGFRARNPHANITILSGDINRDDEPGQTNNDENAGHIVTGSGKDTTARFDGLQISGGNAASGG